MISAVKFGQTAAQTGQKSTPKTTGESQDSPKTPYFKSKTARTAAITTGSVLGAAILFLAGKAFYNRPTQADKALKAALEKKYAPISEAIGNIKQEISTYLETYNQKTQEYLKPFNENLEKLFKIPLEINKQNAEKILNDLEEYKKSKNFIFSKGKVAEINALGEKSGSSILKKAQKIKKDCSDFLEFSKPENQPKTRHSKKITEEFKYKAKNDLRFAETTELLYKYRPQKLSLGFELRIEELKSKELDRIITILTKVKEAKTKF